MHQAFNTPRKKSCLNPCIFHDIAAGIRHVKSVVKVLISRVSGAAPNSWLMAAALFRCFPTGYMGRSISLLTIDKPGSFKHVPKIQHKPEHGDP